MLPSQARRARTRTQTARVDQCVAAELEINYLLTEHEQAHGPGGGGAAGRSLGEPLTSLRGELHPRYHINPIHANLSPTTQNDPFLA